MNYKENVKNKKIQDSSDKNKKNVEKNDWNYDKKIESFTKRLTKNVLEKTYDSSAIIFIILKGMGLTSLKIFLKPTYYIDDPSEFLGEISNFKQIRLKEKNIKQAISRLQQYGLVEKRGNNFLLTTQGGKVAKRILGYKKRLEEKWDKKYRIVIFDIPEIRRNQRNWLRRELHFLGYKKLQNSVFVSRFSLTEELILEIKSRGLEDYINYLLVENVYDLNKGSLDI